MLQLVDVGDRSCRTYAGVAPDWMLEDLVRVAGRLRGARVLHISSTSYGGGVSELLRSMVPILNDLGLAAEWRLIGADTAFFEVTKGLHNGLQGARAPISDTQKALYLGQSRLNAQQLEDRYDFVFVHDPQPAALLEMHGKGNARWIWRCHVDSSAPNADVWSFLRPFVLPYDATVFTMAEFVPPDLAANRVAIIPPAIDPLSPKNAPLPRALAREMLEWIGVHVERPIVTQISRFDPWKDPLGVIRTYQIARASIPGLQLALVGSMALDDPECWRVYQSIQAEIENDPEVHVFTNLVGVGNAEVNAFQSLSNVVVQKSLREGFGLVVSEALWKGTPVVAGRTGGIPLQMADGAGGVLVDDVEQCAAAIVSLLQEPQRAAELGRTGRERVREHFLILRLVLDDLRLMADLSGAPSSVQGFVSVRDPVCGMSVWPGGSAPRAKVAGVEHVFCSDRCRARFVAKSPI